MFTLLLSWFVQAQVAFALVEPPIKRPTSVGILAGNGGAIISLGCLGLRWLFTIAIILSIVFALLAALDYITSAGDPAKVKKATNRIIYAAIGIAVALLARSLPVIVGGVLSIAGSTSSTTSNLCRQ